MEHNTYLLTCSVAFALRVITNQHHTGCLLWLSICIIPIIRSYLFTSRFYNLLGGLYCQLIKNNLKFPLFVINLSWSMGTKRTSNVIINMLNNWVRNCVLYIIPSKTLYKAFECSVRLPSRQLINHKYLEILPRMRSVVYALHFSFTKVKMILKCKKCKKWFTTWTFALLLTTLCRHYFKYLRFCC